MKEKRGNENDVPISVRSRNICIQYMDLFCEKKLVLDRG